MGDTKPCPKCRRNMIKERTGYSSAANPPHIYMMWWCGCGHEEEAGYVRPITPEQARMQRWELANAGDDRD